MKEIIKHVPLLGPWARRIYRSRRSGREQFPGSADYWKQRYRTGGNSGSGSYNELAEFKAEILNRFVHDHRIETVIEFGSGDGNQLRLADYPSYIGYDVSPDAIAACKQVFANDKGKMFKLAEEYAGETAELSLSLDVIYHLVEDTVFDQYMRRLFAAAERFVIIYSSNTDENSDAQAPHVRHRKFSRWVESTLGEWTLLEHIPNKYPYNPREEKGTFADFFVYGRAEKSA